MVGAVTLAAPTDGGAQEATRGQTTPLVFDRVNVIDVLTGTVRPAQRVVVIDRRITAVGPARTVKVPAGATVVRAWGKYLIPGLWDMHAHNLGNTRATYNTYATFLVTGVTGVRDMLSPFPHDSLRRWWQEVLTGTRVSPRVISAGYLRTGEHAKPASRPALFDMSSGIVEVGTPDEGRQSVDSFKAAGVDFIKVHDEAMPRDVYFAIAAEARRLGIPLAGHLPTLTVSMAEASDSGQHSFEHLVMWHTSPCLSADATGDSACAALAARFRRNDTWLTPTMFNSRGSFNDSALARFINLARPRGYEHFPIDTTDPAGPASIVDAMRYLDRLHRFGFRLLAGTDNSYPDVQNLCLDRERVWSATAPTDLVSVPGLIAPLHVELWLMVEAGLTPLEALQTATLNPARYFGATDSLGAVERGKLADLVLLDANPLVDIRNASTVRAVVANGRYFDRAALDALVAEAKERIVAGVSARRQEREAGQRARKDGQP